MRKRKYLLQRRAERMAETRRRIAHAAVELHASIGPVAATITAIAERAGVQRHTVYSHFPDEHSLFRACVTHGLSLWPLPDPSRWQELGNPQRRLATALDELYGYFERTEPMWTNVSRDLPALPALAKANAPVFAHWGAMRRALVSGWPARGRRRRALNAVVGHFLAFATWRSFARDEGLPRKEVVAVAVAAVRGVLGHAATIALPTTRG
jgi:AcrR family transcriptional regulator